MKYLERILQYTQRLTEDPVVLCNKCHDSFPSESNTTIEMLGKYLSEHPANHVALEYEIPKVKDLLQSVDDEIAGYDSVLSRLQNAVRQLAGKRGCLHELRNRLRWTTRTSIRRLPPELLLRIFHMVRSVYASDDNSDHIEMCELPVRACGGALILSHVSAQWRALALNCPQMWSHIQFHFRERRSVDGSLRAVEFAKFCLEKSAKVPLHLRVSAAKDGKRNARKNVEYNSEEEDESDEEDNEDDEGDEDRRVEPKHLPVLAELSKHSDRWKTARFKLRNDNHIVLPPVLPMLERLEIDCALEGVSSYNTAPALAPCLRWLCTNYVQEQPFVIAPALESITTDICHTDVVLQLLRCFPTLPKLISAGPHHQRPPSIPPFEATSHLQTLEVRPCIYNSNGIFEYCTLPSLTILRIVEAYTSFLLDYNRTFPDAPVFIGFLQRSQPPLQTFEIRNCRLKSQHFIDMVKSLPLVSHLIIDTPRHDYHSDLFKQMVIPTVTQGSGQPIILPNLTHLEVFVSEGIDHLPLLDMVRSRRLQSRVEDVGAKLLEKLGMVHQDPFDSDFRRETLVEISSLFEEFGVEVTLTSD